MKKNKNLFLTFKINKSILTVVLVAIVVAASFSVFGTKAAFTEAKTYSIVIDAGHGGIDGGSVGTSTKNKESDLNLEYSFCLKQYFENFNFKVVLTRKDKNGLYSPFAKNKKKDDMAKREKIIKSTNPDIVVSLHMNSFPSKASNGSQVFYKKESEPSFLLAKSIQKQLVQTVPNARKTPQTGDYFMLNCNSAPSVIVECGFLSNKEEDGLLATKQHKEKICYAIFCGVISFFAS